MKTNKMLTYIIVMDKCKLQWSYQRGFVQTKYKNNNINILWRLFDGATGCIHFKSYALTPFSKEGHQVHFQQNYNIC